MPYTQAQIDALKAAIAAGVRVVAFGDQSTTFSSIDEMLKAVQTMEAELAPPTRPRRFGVVTRKAF